MQHERTGDPVAEGAGLAGDAAAFDRREDVELLGGLGQQQGLADDHLENVVAEIVVQRVVVDLDLSGSGAQEDPRGGRLAAAGAVILGGAQNWLLKSLERAAAQESRASVMSRSLGCWAWWGWSGPA